MLEQEGVPYGVQRTEMIRQKVKKSAAQVKYARDINLL